MWQQLARSGDSAGFPACPAALAAVNLDGGEFLAAIGGVNGGTEASTALRPGREFDELCAAEGEAPVELWLSDGPGTCGLGGRGELRPFNRAVLAFPPRPRCGFSLTPLDRRGTRYLLFGGRTGRRGHPGRCLADLSVLEISTVDEAALGGPAGDAPSTAKSLAAGSRAPAVAARDAAPGEQWKAGGSSAIGARRTAASPGRPDSDDDDDEPEEIFFADEYRASCSAGGVGVGAGPFPGLPHPPSSSSSAPAIPCAAGAAGLTLRRPFAVPQQRRRLGGRGDGSDDESAGEEDDMADDDAIFRQTRAASSMPRTYNEVIAKLGSGSAAGFTMTRRTPRAAPKAENAEGVGDGSARWRVPHCQNGVPIRARAGHTAVLTCPFGGIPSGGEASVLIFGGLTDGGIPLGDTFRVALTDDGDGGLEATWERVDEGGSANCDTAPWEQQDKPRPRAGHSAVFWPGGAGSPAHAGLMVIFGGLGLGVEGEARSYGDTWTMTPSRGSGYAPPQSTSSDGSAPQVSARGLGPPSSAARWRRPMTQGGAPVRRWGHGACLVGGSYGGGSTMLICGGVGASGNPLSDCWLLDLEEMRWDSVDTLASHSVLGRSGLLGRTESFDADAIAAAPAEVGACTATWSASAGVAIVWGGSGPWAWREPDPLRQRREDRSRPDRCRASAGAEPAVEDSTKGKRGGKKRHRRREAGDDDAALAEFPDQRRDEPVRASAILAAALVETPPPSGLRAEDLCGTPAFANTRKGLMEPDLQLREVDAPTPLGELVMPAWRTTSRDLRGLVQRSPSAGAAGEGDLRGPPAWGASTMGGRLPSSGGGELPSVLPPARRRAPPGMSATNAAFDMEGWGGPKFRPAAIAGDAAGGFLAPGRLRDAPSVQSWPPMCRREREGDVPFGGLQGVPSRKPPSKDLGPISLSGAETPTTQRPPFCQTIRDGWGLH